MSSEEKTEQPSHHKMAEARKKGQVFKSQEITFALALLVFFAVLKATAGAMFSQFILVTKDSLSNLDIMRLGMPTILAKYGLITLKIMGPLVICAFLVIVLGNMAQVGFIFTTQPLSLNLSKLNPIEGFKRIFSKRAPFELAKNSVKIVLTFWIASDFIQKTFFQGTVILSMSLKMAFFYYAKTVYVLGMRVALLFFVLALFDYLYQRYEFFENMKMTKQEVKEEGKQQEGDPFIKGKQREKRMKLSRARMMEGVKKAKVVITNPTHIACALRYEDEMDAPMLVAKGQHLIAKKIVEVAREHNVPVIENKPVAWSIYNNVDIEEYIPAPLYPVVAEVIFYVLKLDEERKEKEL